MSRENRRGAPLLHKIKDPYILHPSEARPSRPTIKDTAGAETLARMAQAYTVEACEERLRADPKGVTRLLTFVATGLRAWVETGETWEGYRKRKLGEREREMAQEGLKYLLTVVK